MERLDEVANMLESGHASGTSSIAVESQQTEADRRLTIGSVVERLAELANIFEPLQMEDTIHTCGDLEATMLPNTLCQQTDIEMAPPISEPLEDEIRRLNGELLATHRCQKDLVFCGADSKSGPMKLELEQRERELQDQLRELRNTKALAKAEQNKCVVRPPLLKTGLMTSRPASSSPQRRQ